MPAIRLIDDNKKLTSLLSSFLQNIVKRGRVSGFMVLITLPLVNEYLTE
ncbi:hypothetical protein [Rheinheimera maricola]|uniref:Uncharacterized protein n=1 Tax=Rheinheimera maricola TaxID=2793282 RepID=A0ABS7XBF2_9GAMM|nr:hypothetical protein [Rheinheimera maricola]MBZ9612888.1 hypothetical protein [Rheinheimera maricola]